MIATCFALVAFAAAIALGWSVGNPTASVIWHALLALGICWCLGLAVGTVLQGVNERSIAEYKQRHPMTVDPAGASAQPETADAPASQGAGAAAAGETERNVTAT